MRIVGDRLAGSILLAAWSPTMDVCAVVTGSRAVEGRRASWQRLWFTEPEDAISSLSWRPDGRALAVACSRGVVFLDGEVGNELACIDIDFPECISWAGKVSRYLPRQSDRASQLFPRPSNEEASVGGLLDAGWSVLAAAKKSGEVSLLVYGVLHAGTAHIGPGTLVSLRLSSDLMRLSAVVKEDGGGYAIRSRELAMLDEEEGDFGMFCLHMANIKHLVSHAEESIASAKKEWSVARDEFAKRFTEEMEQHLRDQAVHSSVEDNLTLSLATGTASAEVQHFLLGTLGEQGAQRLLAKMDSAAGKTHSLLLEQASAAIEAALYRLGELRAISLSRLQSSIADSGKVEAAISACTVASVAALRAAHETAKRQRDFRAFLMWILRLQRILDKPDAQFSAQDLPLLTQDCISTVLSFLQEGLVADSVSEILSRDDKIDEASLLATIPALSSASEILSFADGSSVCDFRLGQRVRQVSAALHGLREELSGTVSSHILPCESEVHMPEADEVILSEDSDGFLISLALESSNGNQAMVVSRCSQESGCEHRRVVMPVGVTVRAMAMNKGRTILVLAERKGDAENADKTRRSELLRLPMEALSQVWEGGSVSMDEVASERLEMSQASVGRMAASETRDMVFISAQERRAILVDMVDDEDDEDAKDAGNE